LETPRVASDFYNYVGWRSALRRQTCSNMVLRRNRFIDYFYLPVERSYLDPLLKSDLNPDIWQD
jgi:hypothetical protein